MANTPTLEWTRSLGTTESDFGRAVTIGLDGAIYISGYTGGSLDGQTHSGGYDAFLTKYSSDGVKEWTRLLGTSADDFSNALTTGLDGAIYMSGRTGGSLDGQTYSGDRFDAFLTKYSPDGVKQWTRLLGTSADDFSNALTTGLDGAIYMSGFTFGSLDGQTNNGLSDAFLTKYSSDGVKEWTRLLGSNGGDLSLSVTTGLDGAIYMSGVTYGPLDGQTNNGFSDAFLTKYSPDGVKQWTRLLGTIRSEWGDAVTTGLDGAIYIGGSTRGSLDGQTNNGSSDALLTKYSPDGVKQWTRLLGTSADDLSLAVTTGLDGTIYISGYSSGSLDGQTNSGKEDAFLTKYSPDGVKQWTRLLGTSADDRSQAVKTGLDGAIYISGYTGGSLDGQINIGGSNAFLAKYSIPKASYSVSSSSSSVDEGSTATFTLLATNVDAGTPVAYTVSGLSSADVLGGALSGSVIVGSNGQATISIPIAEDNLTEGTETLTVTAQGKSASVAINDTSTGTAGSDSSLNPQGIYTLNVIVDLFGQVLYLKDLKETITSTSHTVEYAGTTFNWSEVDSFVTTVTRDGNFTEEFAQEIVDAYPSVAGISYSTAVALVGASVIDDVLLAVAGADGNYVG
jgi:hypothetical protein